EPGSPGGHPRLRRRTRRRPVVPRDEGRGDRVRICPKKWGGVLPLECLNPLCRPAFRPQTPCPPEKSRTHQKPYTPPPRGSPRPRAVAWSPDGIGLVSGSGNFTVRVWDSQSAQEREARGRAPAAKQVLHRLKSLPTCVIQPSSEKCRSRETLSRPLWISSIAPAQTAAEVPDRGRKRRPGSPCAPKTRPAGQAACPAGTTARTAGGRDGGVHGRGGSACEPHDPLYEDAAEGAGHGA